MSWTPAPPLIAPYPESSSRRAVFREILFSDARSPHAGGGGGKGGRRGMEKQSLTAVMKSPHPWEETERLLLLDRSAVLRA